MAKVTAASECFDHMDGKITRSVEATGQVRGGITFYLEARQMLARRAYLDLSGSYLVGMWFPFMREVRKLPDFKVLLRDLGIYDYWRKSGKWGDFARPLGADDFEVW